MSQITAIKHKLKGDRMIWIILVVLSLASLLAVYSASGSLAYSTGGASTEFYLLKQLAVICLGFGLAYAVQHIEYVWFARLAPIMLVMAIILMVVTWAWGVDINDARRWVRIPLVGLTFQSSDFAKLALIIYVARSIADRQDQTSNINEMFKFVLLPIIVICGLIMPADFSTAGMLFITCMSIMVIGRVNWKLLTLIVFLGLIGFGILMVAGTYISEIRSQTWITRVSDYFSSSADDYQIQQAKIAIAEGGIFGNGPGSSVQRNFLPSPYSDFIYAIICEEYGLLGGFSILAIYLYFLSRCVRIVTRTKKIFAALLTIGLSLNILIQAMLNIAVSVDLVPVTGLTLPMVSWGGTSTLFTCFSFGIILSVSHYTEEQRRLEKEGEGEEETSDLKPDETAWSNAGDY
jgi:cell division protein FtsW